MARAALATMLIALGACSDEDEPATGDGGTATSASAGSGEASSGGGACGRLTTGEVSDLFGEAATAVPGPTAATCLWEATGGDADAPTRQQLQLSIYPGDGALDASAYGEGAEPIEDLGDEAFVVADGTLGTTAAYQADDESVVLTYAIVASTPDGPSPAEHADEVVELLRASAGDDSGGG
ncbi:MAG TPA: hypothetical protein VK306_00335 [Acidimicrobiales bacterium]|nr:hypothetical protein [Acidimicrobiales bacterium]